MAFRKFNNFKKKKFEPRLPGTAVAVVNGNVDKACLLYTSPSPRDRG